MECSSDTESETSAVVVTRSIKERPTFDDANPGPDMGTSCFEAVRRAIETLSEGDVSTILGDKSHFQESSELLLDLLDRVPQILGTEHAPEVIQIFTKLGTQFFLQRLLDFRKCVRLSDQVPGSQSIVITWIDVVLAKLGLLSTPIAVGLAACDREKEAEWIRLRREDDTIRAATQLPDDWNAMTVVIGSSNFSPAARRLATSLLFIVYVMVRQMASDNTWLREGPPALEFLHLLYLSINQVACTSVFPSALRCSSFERVQLAMFVSLFADAHSHTEPGDTTYASHLRPEGFGHILEIIQVIIGQSNPSFHVLERPDPAQCILLRWGNIIPWSWTTWSDQRVANTECLRSLSATWFFLVHTPIHGTHHPLDQRILDIDLYCILLSDMFSSSLMVLQLIKEILDKNNRNIILQPTTTQILCKLCWACVQFLETNMLKRDPQFERLVPNFCNELMLLFPFITRAGNEDDLVRCLIVEALTLIPTQVMSSSLKKILQNKQFLTSLDESMQCCIALFSDRSGGKRNQRTQNHFAKSQLNFSSLLVQSAIDDHSLRRTVASFVAYISQSMLCGVDRSLTTCILGSFLTILSLLRSKKPGTIKISDEDIWMLTMQDLNQHLSVAAAFAYTLLTTAGQRRDSLLRHEAWNYLLGVLIKILERQLPEEEEPLALLVSPNICLALRSISYNGITRKCLLASPWTLCMRLSMQKLLDHEAQNEPYFDHLYDRIRSEGLKLLNELSDGRCGTKTDDALQVPALPRLVYHRDCYRSELVPVCDGE